MANFTYMGTKRAFATAISDACLQDTCGPVLDLFAGLSAVGDAIGEQRPMWFNDAQHFSNLYCRVMYCDAVLGCWTEQDHAQFSDCFSRNHNFLRAALESQIEAETALDRMDCVESYLNASEVMRQEARTTVAAFDRSSVHYLFTKQYSFSYIGLRQAVEVDSIRYALDQLLISGSISEEKFRHGLLSLCRAIASASNSTGHFAQFLTPNERNMPRVKSKRRVSIIDQFLVAQRQLVPAGSAAWRRDNRWFNGDAIGLLDELKGKGDVPGVVYADPPYTDDQYSRFYHLLETVVLYDYPDVSGKGIYRGGRLSSQFSLASKVVEAFSSLIGLTADLDAALVISYPANGLLKNSLEAIPALLRTRFSKVLPPVVVDHSHSTLGASKGPHRQNVSELIFVGC